MHDLGCPNEKQSDKIHKTIYDLDIVANCNHPLLGKYPLSRTVSVHTPKQVISISDALARLVSYLNRIKKNLSGFPTSRKTLLNVIKRAAVCNAHISSAIFHELAQHGVWSGRAKMTYNFNRLEIIDELDLSIIAQLLKDSEKQKQDAKTSKKKPTIDKPVLTQLTVLVNQDIKRESKINKMSAIYKSLCAYHKFLILLQSGSFSPLERKTMFTAQIRRAIQCTIKQSNFIVEKMLFDNLCAFKPNSKTLLNFHHEI